jgi:hypothetical protein
MESSMAGVNGGYNILMAYNTFYNVGSRSHTVEFVFGSRSCDNDQSATRCETYRQQGMRPALCQSDLGSI